MDFYIVLGLDRDASPGDVKRAYKRLARRYHPDINPGDRMAAAQFRQIADAYETLIDPERRRRYDAGRRAARRSRVDVRLRRVRFLGERGRGVGVHLRRSVCRRAAPARGAPAHGEPERGADLHQAITLSFEEAMRGGQRQITVTRQERCHTCQGAGRLHTSESRCPHCHGTGAVKSARGHMVFSKAVRALRRVGTPAADPLPDLRRSAVRDAQRAADDSGAARAGRPCAGPGGGHGPRRAERRGDRRSVHHRARGAASALPARRRRPAPRRAGGGSRSGARREDRRAVARRSRAAARAARHAVGPALPAARARRAVAARRPARRPGRRSAARAAEAPRRAVEGAVAGVRARSTARMYDRS